MASNFRLKTAVLALVLVGATAAALAADSSSDGKRARAIAPPTPVRSADGFVASIGVNTHFNYLDTSYARRGTLLARLRELGVRQLRDGVPKNAPRLAEALRAAAAFGARLTLLAGDLRLQPPDAVKAAQREVGPAVFAYEGPNEIDNSGMWNWRGEMRRRMAALRRAVRQDAPTVPVVGPSFVHPEVYPSVDRSTYDVANLHLYPGGVAPEQPIEQALYQLKDLGVSSEVALTETGYHNANAASGDHPPVSEAVAGVYLPRALLTSFSDGVLRTFVYELVDEKADPERGNPEQHFGLLRQNLSRKPAFRAIRNLISAVRSSPGAAPSGLRPPDVRGPDGLRRLDLRRRDGSRLVALWRPVSVWDRDARQPVDPGSEPVDLSWARPRYVVVSRPSASRRAVLRLSSTTSLRLMLAGDVVVVSYR